MLIDQAGDGIAPRPVAGFAGDDEMLLSRVEELTEPYGAVAHAALDVEPFCMRWLSSPSAHINRGLASGSLSRHSGPIPLVRLCGSDSLRPQMMQVG